MRARLAATAAALLALLAAGCASPRPAAPAASTPGASSPTSPPTTLGRRAATRVIVVVEENHSIGQIIGSPQAPFLNRLAAKGTLLTSYYAITHPSLPRLVFITPDLDHDMHGADRWLEDLYGRLAGSSAWRDDTRLVVTWDESDSAGAGGPSGCCGGLASGGQVATIITGPAVRAARDHASYSHYALLRSIETLFHLPFLGHAADPATATIPALT